MIPSNLSIPLKQQLPLFPVWFVLFGGLIATLAFWQACPRPALLTLLALLLLGVTTALGPFVTTWLVSKGHSQGWTAQQIGLYLTEAVALLSLVRAVGYGLLLSAVFIGRRPNQFPPTGTAYPPSPAVTRIL